MKNFEYNEALDFEKLPQEYKGINFYPLLISEENIFKKVMETIGIPKRYIKTEPIIMKMSYLKFLCFILKKKDDMIDILSYITKTETEKIKFEISLRKGANENDLRFEDMNISIFIDNISFNEYDFDIIREIILRQNYYSTEYIEEYDPELEELLEIKQRTLGKDSSFTDKKFILCSLLNKLPEEIASLSYYQFYKLYYVSTMKVNTEIYQGWISSGFISLDKGKNFTTYLDPTPDRSGRYDSIKMTKEDFFNKVGMKPS